MRSGPKHLSSIVILTVILLVLFPQFPVVFASTEHGRWHLDRPRKDQGPYDRIDNASTNDEAAVGIGIDFAAYTEDGGPGNFNPNYDGFTLLASCTANTRNSITYMSQRYNHLTITLPDTQYMTDTGITTDDGGVWVDLGFHFYFYGGPGPVGGTDSGHYSRIWISANGYISFQDDVVCPNPEVTPLKPNAVIAPYWTDLDPSTGHIYYAHCSNPGHHFWVVWKDVRNKANSQLETFALDLTLAAYPMQRGQDDIHFYYQTVHSSGQGWVILKNQEGYRTYSPFPDQYGCYLHVPDDEIYIQSGRVDVASIQKIDLVCTKSDNQAKIKMESNVNGPPRGHNMRFYDLNQDPNNLFEHALSGSVTILLSQAFYHISPGAGLMFDITLLSSSLMSEYASAQYAASQPDILDAGTGDPRAYTNVTAADNQDITLAPVDATMDNQFDWIWVDTADNQFHSVTVTAVVEYYSYYYNQLKTLTTSVILEVEPDVSNTMSSARSISTGTCEWCLDVVDYKDFFKKYLLEDSTTSITMQPPTPRTGAPNAGANYDLYLYAPGSNENSPPIASSTNLENASDSIVYTAETAGWYYIKVQHVYWPGHDGEGIYTLNIESGGGCPYLYTWNGHNYALDNNILPASEVDNGTDTYDYYKIENSLVSLFNTHQTSVYSLQIREFENEYDYIDQAKLMTVDHSRNVNVAVTDTGEIIGYQNPLAPLACVDNNGTDRLYQINQMDGNVSDATTFFQGYAGDWLLMNFGEITSPNANLIFHDDQKCMDVCINIQIPDSNGSWQTVDVLHPRSYWGMEAVNMKPYLSTDRNSSVRLYWTAPHRLDYVGLDTSEESPTQVTSVTPILAIHSSLGIVTPKLLYDDENCVELTNGQQVTMTFVLPKQQADCRDFIFFSNGYYYLITP